MIWFIIEHWFWLSVGGGYLAAVLFSYVRFGREAAIAAASVIGIILVYRKGQDSERQRQQQQAERARQYRQQVEREVGEMGAQDVDRELAKWNRD